MKVIIKQKNQRIFRTDIFSTEEAGSRPKETIAFAELSVDYVESFPTLVQRVRNLSSAISVYIR